MGANAVTSVPVYASGDVLTAANLNITNSGVPVFATTADRDAAFGGSGEKTLAEGQACYIEAAPKRLQVYNGTAWIDFDAAYTDISSTQAFGGFTKGNATVVSKYARFGKFVHFYGRVGLGSTSSMAGPLDVTLPFTAAQGIYYHPSACYFIDASASVLYWGTALNISTTGVRLVTHKVDGTYAINFDVSATAPFTWTTSDGFYWNHIYEAA
jgi:hypothetical protein